MPSPEHAAVRFMIIFFGANDAYFGSSQHVPVEAYKSNLHSIVCHPSVQAQSPRLILITPPPVNEWALEESDEDGLKSGSKRTAEYTKLYADACMRIGRDLGLPVVDLWSSIMFGAGYEPGQDQHLPGSKMTERNTFLDDVLRDGLHFSPLGYELLFQAIMELIERQWPDQRPEQLNFVHPAWQSAPWTYETDSGDSSDSRNLLV
ncbi:MAG: hypothetical protein Q9219_001178 [cf. Caloplaca sp. 3 TL-2023]